MITIEQIKDVVKAYIVTAIWVEDLYLSIDDIDVDEYNRIENDVNKVIAEMKKTLSDDEVTKLVTTEGQEGNLFGHDLYLTRNGHGSGFWDKAEYYGLENSKLLTDIATNMGNDDNFYLYEN